jgi:hypothetical protein
MALDEALGLVNPPRTTTWPAGPGNATSLLVGADSCQGRRPDSTAGNPRDVRVGGVAWPTAPLVTFGAVVAWCRFELGGVRFELPSIAKNTMTTVSTVTRTVSVSLRLLRERERAGEREDCRERATRRAYRTERVSRRISGITL